MAITKATKTATGAGKAVGNSRTVEQ